MIKDLQERLLSLAPDCDDVNNHIKGYTPHLSPGQLKASKGDLTKLINRFQEKWRPIVFLAEKFAFISREIGKYDRFKVKKEIFLKSFTI